MPRTYIPEMVENLFVYDCLLMLTLMLSPSPDFGILLLTSSRPLVLSRCAAPRRLGPGFVYMITDRAEMRNRQ